MAEKIPGGYNGKILRVNLSDHSISVETIDELFCRKYLGGAGFISYFLWKELKQGTDALAPDNKLIFAIGPVTGVQLPGSGRNCIGAKSPLTGGIAKSEVGGFWGAELKRAGYDAIIINGKSEKPVYLSICDGKTIVRDANHLWGKNTKETQDAIRVELGDNRIRVAAIGPAGENLVRSACIMNDLRYAAGRGGLGAVMGSKNLKAISVRGHKAPRIAHPERLREFREWVLSNISQGVMAVFHELGTFGVQMYESMGNLPVRNWRDGSFPGAKNIDPTVIKDTIRIKMEGCFGCPVRCKKVVKFQKPYAVDPVYGGPEYEALAALGSNCGIDNLKAITKANELCNAYSLDNISAGSVIAFAMECFENGLLTTKDTDGIELRFGNAEAMLKMIELIARRKGIGDLLAEGVARASQRIGKGAQDLAVHVKGLEPGQHEPRIKPGLGLSYMINAAGADHVFALHDTAFITQQQMADLRPLGIVEPVPCDDLGPRKVALIQAVQAQRIIQDSLVLCRIVSYSYEQIAGITAAVTGWDTSIAEQLRVAVRILTTARLFNIKEGFTAADDLLPKRYMQPRTDGVQSDKTLDRLKLEKAKRYYYTLMGWDSRTGIPTMEKLEELGLEDVDKIP